MPGKFCRTYKKLGNKASGHVVLSELKRHALKADEKGHSAIKYLFFLALKTGGFVGMTEIYVHERRAQEGRLEKIRRDSASPNPVRKEEQRIDDMPITRGRAKLRPGRAKSEP